MPAAIERYVTVQNGPRLLIANQSQEVQERHGTISHTRTCKCTRTCKKIWQGRCNNICEGEVQPLPKARNTPTKARTQPGVGKWVQTEIEETAN